MKISNWLNKATEELNINTITSAALDAEVLLSFVIKKPREYIFSHPELELSTNQLEFLSKLINRRKNGEPIAYLINNKEFFGLDFYIDKNVLVPRPETELLIETVLEYVESDSSITIADIGTGSGCIAIAIAKNLSHTKIFATDISNSAIKVAKMNAKNHTVTKQINFKCGNLLEPLEDPVDIILANLPYLPKREYKKEISFEPQQALYGTKEGIEYLEKIIKQAPAKLNTNGIMILEIHPPQFSQIKKIARVYFPEANIQIKKDLANRERFVIIKL